MVWCFCVFVFVWFGWVFVLFSLFDLRDACGTLFFVCLGCLLGLAGLFVGCLWLCFCLH